MHLHCIFFFSFSSGGDGSRPGRCGSADVEGMFYQWRLALSQEPTPRYWYSRLVTVSIHLHMYACHIVASVLGRVSLLYCSPYCLHPTTPLFSLIAWLPSLEKEMKSLEPHENFRLWLTTESHPKFPPILLQSSLKITYEAPPGVRRNLQRTFESWSQDFVERGHSVVRSQALFALAWFHAVVQERRMLIPQGWSKFYEFSLSDLRAGASIIDRLCAKPGMGVE